MAVWQPPQIRLEENYGVKQDSLVDSCADELRRILLEKRDRWIATKGVNLEDFIKAHPNQRWSSRDQRKFQSPGFEDFDLPLCAKWLIEFRWQPYEVSLGTAELASIGNLQKIRNDVKHKGSSRTVTELEYLGSCKVVQDSLRVLGLDAETINSIITSSAGVTIVNKADIFCEIQTLNDNQWPFQTIGILGSGSFGIVLHVEKVIDRFCSALKVVPNRMTNHVSESDLREARNLACLKPHPNVVKYITSNFFQLSRGKFKEIIGWGDGNASHFAPATQEWISACLHSPVLSGCYIQTEVCGESLRTWLTNGLDAINITKCSDDKKERICKDILAALDFIHNGHKGHVIVHRDLRPENIYFAKSGFQFPIKVGDFGLSNNINIYADVTQTTQVGNSFYRAPEIDAPHPTHVAKAKYGPAVDLFSAGLIVAEVYDPIPVNSLRYRYDQIVHKRAKGNFLRQKYPEVRELVLSLTEEAQESRATGLIGPNGRYLPLKRISVSPAKAPLEEELNLSKTMTALNLTDPVKALTKKPQSSMEDTSATSPLGKNQVILACSSQNEQGSVRRLDYDNHYARVQRAHDVMYMYLMPDEENRNDPLAYKSIPDLRKLLQKEKRFWDDPNQVANFFEHLTGISQEAQQFTAPNTKSAVNRYLYNIHKENPGRLTRSYLEKAFANSGLPKDKLGTLEFGN